MEERIKRRIAELLNARAVYEAEAKAQMMGFNAAIGELEALLQNEDEREGNADPQQ